MKVKKSLVVLASIIGGVTVAASSQMAVYASPDGSQPTHGYRHGTDGDASLGSIQFGMDGIPTGATVYYGAMKDYYNGQEVYYYTDQEWEDSGNGYKYWATYGSQIFDDGLHAQFWTVLDNSATNTGKKGMFWVSSGLVKAALYWPGDSRVKDTFPKETHSSCYAGSDMPLYRESILQPMGEDFYNYAFSSREKEHIMATTKSDSEYTTSFTGPTTGSARSIKTEAYPDVLKDDHIFSLSAEEVDTYMYKADGSDWDALANFQDPSRNAGFQGAYYWYNIISGQKGQTDTRTVPLGYWLRSPVKSARPVGQSDHGPGLQVTTNYISQGPIYPQPHVGWRPAMNFDGKGVLLASSVLSKSSGAVGEDCLKEQEQNGYNDWGKSYGSNGIDASYAFGNRWKLTMLDETRHFDAKIKNIKFPDGTEESKTGTDESKDETESGESTKGTDETTEDDKKKGKAILTVDYTGATSNKASLTAPTAQSTVNERNTYVQAIQDGLVNQVVSAMITDKEQKKVLYYGHVKEINGTSEESGEITLALPEGIDMTQCRLFLFSEQANAPVVSASMNGAVINNESGFQKLMLRRFFDSSKENVPQQLQRTSVPAYDYYTDYASPMIELLGDVEINGTKTWEDFDNVSGDRPDEITVSLLANGKKVSETKTNAEAGWQYSFTGFPERGDDLRLIDYTVVEGDVPKYIFKAEEPVRDEDNHKLTLDITNTKIPGKWNIYGVKKWDDKDNAEGARPKSIMVKLLANGKEVDSMEADSSTGWSYAFGERPAEDEEGREITYTIAEEPVDGYVFSAEEPSYNVDEAGLTLNMTNIRIETKAAKTGDVTRITAYVIVAAAACAVVVITIGERKRRR